RCAGQGKEPLLVSTVGPELRVDRVGDQARRRLEILDGGEESCFAQLAWEVVGDGRLRRRREAMDLPAHPVEEIQFARVVLAPADNATGRGDQLLMPGDLLAVVAKGPDPAGVEVTVDVSADEVLQTLAVINVAARQRAEVRMRMLDDGRQD